MYMIPETQLSQNNPPLVNSTADGDIVPPLPSQDEPLTPDDDVDRQLRARKQQQPNEDESAEIEAASFKKFPVEVNSLARVSVQLLAHVMALANC